MSIRNAPSNVARPFAAIRMSSILAGSLALCAIASPLLGHAGTKSHSKSASSAKTKARVSEDFHWSWRLKPGQAIEIKGINGSIRATPASGDEVEVIATKRARKSDPAEVKIEIMEHADGVTVCAVYPNPGGPPNECTIGSVSHSHTRNNDVEVRFEVRVPKGIRFIGRTVNGGIEATDLDAAAEAYTVNGSVSVSTTGLARAETVNGSIDAIIGTSSWSDQVDFTTVNGGITLECPQELNARFDAATTNGNISSDFPLTVKGNFGRRHISGTVGKGGGGALKLSTVNGNIELHSAAQ